MGRRKGEEKWWWKLEKCPQQPEGKKGEEKSVCVGTCGESSPPTLGDKVGEGKEERMKVGGEKWGEKSTEQKTPWKKIQGNRPPQKKKTQKKGMKKNNIKKKTWGEKPGKKGGKKKEERKRLEKKETQKKKPNLAKRKCSNSCPNPYFLEGHSIISPEPSLLQVELARLPRRDVPAVPWS